MTAFFSILSRLISAANSALRRSSKSGTVSPSSRLSFSYISSVVVSVIILLCDELQAHIEHLWRMCQSADGNVVDASAGNFENICERYVARRLEFGSSVADGDCLAHRFSCHIIEQNSFNSELQSFAHIVERS